MQHSPDAGPNLTAIALAVDDDPRLEPTLDQWIIYGIEYPVDAFGNIFWKHGWTLGLSSGLLVSLTSD